MEKTEYARLGETRYTGRLACGLPVIVVPKPGFQKKFAFFATNYGGMDMRYALDGQECDTPAGVAHFLEHKMFDTKEGNALQMLTGNGASPNAFTASDLTGYYFECTDGFEENLALLLSFVSEPWFTQASVDKEQGIIGQEIAMIEDNPNWRVFHDLLTGLYDHHPIRVSVAGSAASIAQITADTLYECHRAFYHPGNMVLCVAGDVDPARVMEIGERVLSAPGRGTPERRYGQPEGTSAAQSRVTERMAVSAPLFLLGFKADGDAPGAGSLRDQILGELAGELLAGESSPLYRRLYDGGLIDRSFGVSYENYAGAAFLMMGGESPRPDEVRAAVLEEAARLADTGVDEALFRRVSRAVYGSRVRGLNSFEHICIRTAQTHFHGEDFFDFPRAFDSVTKADVDARLRALIREEGACLAEVLPEKDRG